MATPKSEKFWDKKAKTFDTEENPDSPVRQRKYEMIRKYLNKDQMVLDHGCATGSLSLQFANNVKEIHGVDISNEMVVQATQKAKERNLHNARFIHAEILDGQLDSIRYDVILTFYVLHLVENPETTFKKLCELLKPGGLLILEVPCMAEKKGLGSQVIKGFSKLAGLPYLHSFTTQKIDALFAASNLSILENEIHRKDTPRYFVVGQKGF